MLKLNKVTKVKVLFLVLVFVFNFDLFKFSAAILEKGLFNSGWLSRLLSYLEFFCQLIGKSIRCLVRHVWAMSVTDGRNPFFEP